MHARPFRTSGIDPSTLDESEAPLYFLCGLRGIAQLVEQLIPNQQVGSSSLSAPATHFQDTFGCLFFCLKTTTVFDASPR